MLDQKTTNSGNVRYFLLIDQHQPAQKTRAIFHYSGDLLCKRSPCKTIASVLTWATGASTDKPPGLYYTEGNGLQLPLRS
jgi:hypothetical protein